jgi:ABC-2 type transport system ATP-binding protein
MKQRLGLAQAIVNDPDYIFLDEPLDGLDPIGRREIKQIILDLKKRKKTIFFNSHILSDVEEICDQIGIINKGRLIYAGSIVKFRGKKTLEEKFVEVIQTQSPKLK